MCGKIGASRARSQPWAGGSHPGTHRVRRSDCAEFCALALAALISLSGVSVVAAADPSPAVDPVATAPVASPEPPATPEPTPSAAPSAEPDASVAPTPAASSAVSPTPPAGAPADRQAETARQSTPVAVDSQGRPIAAGHYLVMLKGNADPTTVASAHRKSEGTIADRAFRHAFRGFAAKLDNAQRAATAGRPERRRRRTRRGRRGRGAVDTDRHLPHRHADLGASRRSTGSTSGSMRTSRSSIPGSARIPT